MAKQNFADLKVRLIQARSEADMELQEQECFIERCEISPDQLESVNVVRDTLSVELLDDVDAVMIGGAGEFSAHKEYTWMPALLDIVTECFHRRLPLFGSCWGHQVIARALGGTVIHDKSRAEMGCGTVTLTAAGVADPLFAECPPSFVANMGHHDRVDSLPPGAIELATSETQGNQAFRMVGTPIYGTQFHSELDAKRERERLLAYRQFYLATVPDERDFWKIVDSLQDTTDVDRLLNHFLRTFCIEPSAVAHRPDETAR